MTKVVTLTLTTLSPHSLSQLNRFLFKSVCAFDMENETFLLLGWERRCQYLPYFTFSHCCESGAH